MRKIFFFLLFTTSIVANAQIELHGYGGYVPGSNTAYSYSGYRLRIDGGGNFEVLS